MIYLRELSLDQGLGKLNIDIKKRSNGIFVLLHHLFLENEH